MMSTMKDIQKSRQAEDIVLIINPSLWYKPMYPTGILCLSNYLEAHGIPSTIIDSRFFRRKIGPEEGLKLIIDTVRDMKPKLVGFSSTHAEFDEVVKMTARLNKSAISDVIREKTNLKRKYLFRSMLRSIFAGKELIGLMLKREPLGRIKAILRFALTHLLRRP